MFTKQKIKQTIRKMKVASDVGDLNDFDIVYSDWAVTAWSGLVTRLGLDVVVDDGYMHGIHVWFSLRIGDKDGNKETFNKIIDSDFGFVVGEKSDEEILADITEVVNGWQEQYENIKRRFEID